MTGKTCIDTYKNVPRKVAMAEGKPFSRGIAFGSREILSLSHLAVLLLVRRRVGGRLSPPPTPRKPREPRVIGARWSKHATVPLANRSVTTANVTAGLFARYSLLATRLLDINSSIRHPYSVPPFGTRNRFHSVTD